MSHFILRAL